MTGRPSIRTPEIVERIIAGLSIGTPLTIICAGDDMPADRTVRDWIADDEDLSAAIARARETGHDAIAWRIRQTVRGKGEGDGGDSSGDVQRDKLIADTDFKLLAKWDPKRYGDKIQHTGDGGGAIGITITSDDEKL